MKKLLLAAVLFSINAVLVIAQKPVSNFKLLIGTYTNAGNSEGIYYYQFNADGSAKAISQQKAIDPSFLVT
ncbi:MAG: hypothetical protein Q8J87_14210, partial [Sediminibacterium sp.]|nr:hypothetical protein [Sediminibacterium sp.]